MAKYYLSTLNVGICMFRHILGEKQLFSCTFYINLKSSYHNEKFFMYFLHEEDI